MGHFLLLPHRDAQVQKAMVPPLVPPHLPMSWSCPGAYVHAPLPPLCPSACMTPPSASAPASTGSLSFSVTLVNLIYNVFKNMIIFLFFVCPASPTDPRTECLLFLCTCQSSFGDCLQGGPPTIPPMSPSSKRSLPPRKSDLAMRSVLIKRRWQK